MCITDRYIHYRRAGVSHETARVASISDCKMSPLLLVVLGALIQVLIKKLLEWWLNERS